jgi:hypothetical protein
MGVEDSLRRGRERGSSGERKDVLDDWREAADGGNGRTWVRKGEDVVVMGERVEDASVGEAIQLFRKEISMTDKGTDTFTRGADASALWAGITISNGRGRASCPATNPRFLRRNITTAKHRAAMIMVPPTDTHTATMIVSCWLIFAPPLESLDRATKIDFPTLSSRLLTLQDTPVVSMLSTKSVT